MCKYIIFVYDVYLDIGWIPSKFPLKGNVEIMETRTILFAVLWYIVWAEPWCDVHGKPPSKVVKIGELSHWTTPTCQCFVQIGSFTQTREFGSTWKASKLTIHPHSSTRVNHIWSNCFLDLSSGEVKSAKWMLSGSLNIQSFQKATTKGLYRTYNHYCWLT